MADYYDSIPGEERVVASSTLNADLRAVLADFHHQGGDAQRAGDALVAVLDLTDECEEASLNRIGQVDTDEIRAAIAKAIWVEEGNHG